MSWIYIQEYDIYNITLTPTCLKCSIFKDFSNYEEIPLPETSEEAGDAGMIYSFDVNNKGEYLGLPEIQDLIFRTYNTLGINVEKLRPDQKLSFVNQID